MDEIKKPNQGTRREDRELNGSYTVAQRLLPRHFKIQDLHLAGNNARQISDALNMSYRQVHNILKSPSFQHQSAVRRATIESSVNDTIIESADAVNDAIRQQTMNAVQTLVGLLNSDNEPVARQAANDILDRGGFPKVTKSDNTNKSTITIDEDVAKRLEIALEELND